MKRFLLGGLLATCAVLSLSSHASADVLGPFADTITYRLTDLQSGTNGSFVDFSTNPGVRSNAGVTPYFTIPAFDESVGVGRVLQSVSIQYTLRIRTQFTVTNTSAQGSQPGTITASTQTYGSLFYNTTGDTAGNQANLGGQFQFFNNPNNIPGGSQTLTTGSGNVVFTNVAVGETRQSGVINNFATATYTFDASTYNSGAPGAITSDAVINGFKASSVNPVRIGLQTITGGGASILGGGNTAFSQDTADQGELLVTYTYQPVPAPPAAVSLVIGGLVGMVGTGVNRLRRRATKRK